ncbi:hypothetical protein DF186_23400, partial [Enterococcus hirae]
MRQHHQEAQSQAGEQNRRWQVKFARRKAASAGVDLDPTFTVVVWRDSLGSQQGFLGRGDIRCAIEDGLSV